jgi:hypothetical protein
MVDIDTGKQCGASGQDGFYRIFEAPILTKFRNGSCREIKCEKLRQFLHTEWPGSNRNTLK